MRKTTTARTKSRRRARGSAAQKPPRRSPTATATERLRRLVDHPPEGGAIAEAKKFGVDLYAVLENLKLTPAERFRRAAEETDFVRRLRGNVRKAKS